MDSARPPQIRRRSIILACAVKHRSGSEKVIEGLGHVEHPFATPDLVG